MDKLRPAIFCFSHLRWAFVWQRPQHLMTRAASVYDVFYCEEPVLREIEKPSLEIHEVEPHVRVLVPILPQRSTPGEIVGLQHSLIASFIASVRAPQRVFWYYTPMALAFTRGLDRDVTVYDNMDELSAFRGASSDLLAMEAELFDQADVVFTGGRSLFEAKRTRHRNVHCFPSSIDAAHFASARLKLESDPQDQAAIPHPRIGFFGVIDERLDTALLGELGNLCPDWQFVMIGPVVKIGEEDLPRAENIHWLGMRSYRDLPAYLARWDAGIMPFAMNESTRFISPTKTPEFLAAGLPVVSTPVQDVVVGYGDAALVEIAATAPEMAQCLRGLLNGRRAGWLNDVDARLGTESWDATWSRMDRLLRAVNDWPEWNAVALRSLLDLPAQ